MQGGSGLANWTLQNPYGGRVSAVVHSRRAARRITSKRQVELEWRRANRNALRQYIGQWVVLERNQIKASGSSLGEAVRQARASGIATPYVFRVESDEDVATFGL
jgi:hypothetical protein